MKSKKRIVLAYSGGLDTSIILKWLQENYNAEVICYTADIGQKIDRKKIISNAKKSGVKNIIINEMMNQRQKDLQRLKKQKNRKYKKRRKFTKEELDEIIRRAIYKSPITSLLGPETLMNVPSGKIYSFDGNKGKK